MKEQKRGFTGVWIPKHIVEDKNLSAVERIIYMEIASFPVCYMKNETYADRAGCSEKTVARALKNLVEIGYIKLLKYDGRMKYYQAVLDREIKEIEVEDIDGIREGGEEVYSKRTISLVREDKKSSQTGQNVRSHYIDNNIDNNKEESTTLESLRAKRAKLKSREIYSQDVSLVISAFKEHVDARNGEFYKNKTQRTAGKFLVDTYGIEKTVDVIIFIGKNLDKIFNPPTTPLELKNKWVKVEAEVKRLLKPKGPNVIM